MTDEEFQLRRRARHRLIGAVTLVTGLVVFLPMVLDNEPKPVAEDIAISIPSQDAKPVKPSVSLVPKIAPAMQPAPAAPQAGDAEAKLETPPVQPLTVLPGGQAPKPAQPALAELVKTEPAKPEKPVELVKVMAKSAPVEPVKPAPKEVKQAEPAVSPPAAEKAKSAVKSAENAALSQSGFVVRLGAFSQPENAKQLKAKLTSMGVRNYSDVLKTASGDKIRVRAGIYATRREAESVRERLKAVDIVGDVVPKP